VVVAWVAQVTLQPLAVVQPSVVPCLVQVLAAEGAVQVLAEEAAEVSWHLLALVVVVGPVEPLLEADLAALAVLLLPPQQAEVVAAAPLDLGLRVQVHLLSIP